MLIGGLAVLSAMPSREHTLRCFDGSTRIVQDSGIALPDGMLMSLQDLTERERAAQEVRRLNADLEQRVLKRTAELSAANRELNSFAAEAGRDAALAEGLLVNLLDNAWKYSDRTPQARISFRRGTVEGLTGFCVCDNGAGFDTAKAGHLFEPFQRLHQPSEF